MILWAWTLNLFIRAVPLVKIKQAIARTRQETSQMDVRIGLLQHMQLRQTVNSKLRMSDGDVHTSGC